MSTTVDFYYDPCCPFCWVTSRWLVRVQEDRDITVTWRPFSLAIKNDELGNGTADHNGRGHIAGHRVLRVIAAAEKNGADAGELYTAFGRAYHTQNSNMDDTLIATVLKDHGLDASFADAADDDSWDAHLEAEQQAALDAVGNDVGVPIVLFTKDGAEPQGYFGPVINALPSREEGLDLWDGLEKLAPVPSFYELKRTRPKGGPDTTGTDAI
ncbi:disulfide bond formation protein DsbA [Arthrobacter sp. HMSC06H05]|uniref:DsbA family protein n=1 Tax=Arthrobacter sp. HMSC06H05 TaxID=1581128 RepID=UPI0008A21810|nr:DsbA family protein [Arthrobacter sp. HMSC06H05]OFT42659.1 disulfide bond formation protein DsbA [Arthrobacter sp. HMSC06H05]